MKLSRKVMSLLLAVFMTSALATAAVTEAEVMYENSDFIETEQPELSEESKQLISLYQKNPTEENYQNLRNNVIDNYNAVLARKEAKLAELKTETAGKPGGEELVAEMEEIVQEMYITYWSRINSSMLRFTDTRLLKWRISEAAQYEYIPVMGAGESIYVKRTPVTNAEYAAFITETGGQAPSNWTDGTYPNGEDDYPVNFVSYADAESYCAWLTEQDGVNTYRLPSESEWELAAGHMPKDADFNCGVNDGRVSVEEYAGVTRGAHGAIDFWGNVWEWTSTVRNNLDGVTSYGVKGGSWKTDKTDCRTEYRKESRDGSEVYDDVGFRVIQVKNGMEPEQKVELATLSSPVVSASSSNDSITLSWQPVDGATEYQLFEYSTDTDLVQMLQTTNKTSVTINRLESGSTHSYIVQPISYREIADNVSAENSVSATCGAVTDETALPFIDITETDVYYDAVKYVYEKGLFIGVSGTEFAPELTMTRAMFVTVLGRLSNVDTALFTETSFNDVTAEEWYAPYVEWAAKEGLVNGYGDGLFGASDEITIQQTAAILARYAEMNGGTVDYTIDSSAFQDIDDTEEWALTQMMWAVENGIYTVDNGMLLPNVPAPRALLAEMLYNYDGLLNKTTAETALSMNVYETNEIKYWLYTPSNAKENMPLIVYLHGISGKGDNPDTVLEEGFPKFLKDGNLGEISAYVLIPQLSPEQKDWVAMKETVISLIHEVADKYKIDNGNISLTGFSVGGAGVWNIAASYPEMFSRIAPCSGGVRSDDKTLSALSQMPIWAFVGTDDTVVEPKSTIDFIEKLSPTNTQARVTEFEGASHTDVTALAYLETDVVDWLISGNRF